ncbi:MAG TPA: hypothetical protein PKH68_01460 [Paludibacteraceae bacterium]|nr:hypothetical protein [Paludibacteraceae bacterium]
MKLKTAEERAIPFLKNKVKLDDYNKNGMFKDGFFNPICPPDYNFITGKQEPLITSQRGMREVSLARRVNGTPIFRN